jgi:hypothetical protein
VIILTKKPIANKREPYDFAELVLNEMRKIKPRGKLLPLPEIRYRLGCILHIPKSDVKLVLQQLESEGKLKLHPFNGVELLV